MWKVAREMFIILQEELNISKKQINEVDIEAIKDVLGKIGQLKNMIDGVRGKNSKVQTISKEIDGNLIDVKDLVKRFEEELRSANKITRWTAVCIEQSATETVRKN